MKENKPPVAPKDAPVADDSFSDYFDKLGDKRTARHASEEGMSSPPVKDVQVATGNIRNDIKGVFGGSEELYSEPVYLTELKATYWSRAQHVGTEHGAKANYELDDYLQVDPQRSYHEIKEELTKEYSKDSIPGSALDGIDAYHQVLGINPAHAATIMTELIGRGLPRISEMADELMSRDGLSLQEASSVAFSSFVNTEVPYHINSIIDEHGYGDDAIRPYMAKSSFYPKAESEKQDAKIELSVRDVRGLVKVYDIQSRPYDDSELAKANELASNPAMQAAMIRIQESLVAFSENYLRHHPDRARGNLRNFSEIFVPQYSEDKMDLLPNPKLLRAMVNNVLPGIVVDLDERGLGVEQVDEEAIQHGVEMASKEYKLFTANIGQFSDFDPKKDTAELHAIYRVVCPANSLFPNFLTANLARYFTEEKTALQ